MAQVRAVIGGPIVTEATIGVAFDKALTLLPGPGAADRPEARNNLGLREQASVTLTGVMESTVVAPYRVEFMPTPTLTASQPNAEDFSRDFRTVLSTIPAGTTLYNIVLFPDQNAPNGTVAGRIVTTTPLVASQYGDERLYFRHASKRF